MDTEKMCKGCDLIKPRAEFTVDSTRRNGMSTYCSPCASARCRGNYRKNQADRLQKSRAYRVSDPRRYKDIQLRGKYGITLDRYDELLAVQRGGCAVCGLPEPDGRYLAVDHDHACCPGPKSCGTCVRGLLCANDNRAIGLMKDDPARATKVVEYLIGAAPFQP